MHFYLIWACLHAQDWVVSLPTVRPAAENPWSKVTDVAGWLCHFCQPWKPSFIVFLPCYGTRIKQWYCILQKAVYFFSHTISTGSWHPGVWPEDVNLWSAVPWPDKLACATSSSYFCMLHLWLELMCSASVSSSNLLQPLCLSLESQMFVPRVQYCYYWCCWYVTSVK